ncbi:5770_t:CDS:1, partial [Funneliformis caledonium]
MSEYEVNDDYDKKIQYDDTNLTDPNLDFILNSSEMNLIQPEDLDKTGECS